MKKLFIFLILSFSTAYIFSQGSVKGKIADETGNGIPFVNVYIKSQSKGTATNDEGFFEIENLKNGTYEVSFSSLGHSTLSKNVTINSDVVDLGTVTLQSSDQLVDEIVVSGSRKLEKLTESPATINVLKAKELEQLAGSAEELFAQQKGVDFARAGAFIGGFNVRGFNSAFNPKMLQLDDNRYSTLIATGLGYGPMSPIIKEDIERVEIVLGPSSALYGPNALNGLVNTLTKSPYKYQGTDIVVGGGSNSLLSARVRHAKTIGDKWAYKVTAEYTQGQEIDWTDSVYRAGVGYPEVDLDRDVNFMKGMASVFYRPGSHSEFGVTYGGSKSNYISVTNAGRNQIKDWQLHFLQATFKSKNWFAQMYQTWSLTDETFNINTRTDNYLALMEAGQTHEEALANSLEGPRPNNFKDNSKRFNGELQYNNSWGGLDLTTGAQLQVDNADSKQTYLLDQDGPIEIYQLGVYGQLKYAIAESGMNLILSARGDNHDLFGFNLLPKAGVTYTKGNGTWRLTYGKGFATPTILNTNMNLFGGIVLGNGEGFTLSDGTKVDPLKPETVQTFEAGYKGHMAEGKLYIDANAYYNISDDFLSPLTAITAQVPVTHRGETPITEVPGGPASGAFILTYLNFGHVNTYGFDLGLNYYITSNYSVSLNYSFFDFSLDTDDMANDGNGDGEVTVLDLPINTPKNKISGAFNVNFDKFYGTIFARWIEKYDFFSGRNVAAKTNTDIVIGVDLDPVVEDQRVDKQWNYGQLGGFYLSVNAGYRITKNLSIGAYLNNLAGTGNYEFVASPVSEMMYGAELKVKF